MISACDVAPCVRLVSRVIVSHSTRVSNATGFLVGANLRIFRATKISFLIFKNPVLALITIYFRSNFYFIKINNNFTLVLSMMITIISVFLNA